MIHLALGGQLQMDAQLSVQEQVSSSMCMQFSEICSFRQGTKPVICVKSTTKCCPIC